MSTQKLIRTVIAGRVKGEDDYTGLFLSDRYQLRISSALMSVLSGNAPFAQVNDPEGLPSVLLVLIDLEAPIEQILSLESNREKIAAAIGQSLRHVKKAYGARLTANIGFLLDPDCYTQFWLRALVKGYQEGVAKQRMGRLFRVADSNVPALPTFLIPGGRSHARAGDIISVLCEIDHAYAGILEMKPQIHMSDAYIRPA